MTDSELTIRGGRYAGRTLFTPDDDRVRPMRSRIRQAIFDRVSDHVIGSAFLDCFAGTGAMGIEALSRGAEKAVFLDHSPASLSCIRRNVESIQPEGTVQILQRDLLEDHLPMPDESSFHMISITPPYRLFQEPDSRRKLVNFMGTLGSSEYVGETTRMIVECEEGTRLGRAPGTLSREDQQTFGNTEIHWFRTGGSSE